MIRFVLVLLLVDAKDGHQIERKELQRFESPQACLIYRAEHMVPEPVRDGVARIFVCEKDSAI
jgi:hypothetical protein